MKINKQVKLVKHKGHYSITVTNSKTKIYFNVTNKEETVIIRLSDATIAKIIKQIKKGERK